MVSLGSCSVPSKGNRGSCVHLWVGSTGGVGVHACMWTNVSTSALFLLLSPLGGKGSTVSLQPTLGGWARRARWWCRVQHTQAWRPTFAFAHCCRDGKDLLFHMLVLVTTHPSTLCSLPGPNQMAPWTLFTLGDGPRCRACPSASSFRPFGFPHSSALRFYFKCRPQLLNCRCFQVRLTNTTTSWRSNAHSHPCRLPLFFLFFLLLAQWHVFNQIVSHQAQTQFFPITDANPPKNSYLFSLKSRVLTSGSSLMAACRGLKTGLQMFPA